MRWLCALLCLALVPGGQNRDIRDLLPSPDVARPWTQSGEPLVYEGDDLYRFIDGGADLYFEYGFVRALSADYEGQGGSFGCTIYEMADPEAAFGIFSYSRSRGDRRVSIGAAGFEADARLAFWQDRYFITLERFSAGKDTPAPLAPFAAAISRTIGRHAAPPPILGRLPQRSLIEASEKLLAGRLAVESLLYLDGADVFQLEKPDRVLYGEYESSPAGTKLFLAIYQAPEKARRVHAHVRALFTPERGYRLQSEAVGRTYWMKNDRYVALRYDADSLTLVVDAPSLEGVTALIGS